jgi:hypothetical protein
MGEKLISFGNDDSTSDSREEKERLLLCAKKPR